jgi:hypothetical protein
MAKRPTPKAKPAAKKKPATADGIPVHCAHHAIVPTVDLKPNIRNPNMHPEAQIALLAKVIQAQGWRRPITVSERSGLIVVGHGRLLAAVHMGVKEVPVDYQPYDSAEMEHADLIADNRLPELSEIDEKVLRELMTEMDTGLIDLELTGFSQAQLENMLAPIPPPPGSEGNTLPPPPDSGVDDRSSRFILIYTSDAERDFWMQRLGFSDPTRVVVSPEECGFTSA